MPAVFVDLDNRSWALRITIGAAARIKTEHGVDLFDAGEALQKIATDPVLMVKIIRAICLMNDGVTWEMLADAMDGETAEAAVDALRDAVVDFCPSQSQRQALRAALARARSAETQIAAAAIPAIEEQIDQEMRKAIATCGSFAGSLPAQSDSIHET